MSRLCAPLANAMVVFKPEVGMAEVKDGVEVPQGPQVASMARTTAEGKYSLLYVQGTLGASIGTHRVEISGQDEKGYERVPIKYNGRSELQRDVKAGSNPIDFALTSK